MFWEVAGVRGPVAFYERASAGQVAGAYVQHVSGGFDFYVYTPTEYSQVFSTSLYDGQSAEYIVEDPNGAGQQLADFGNLDVESAGANGNIIDSYPYTSLTMTGNAAVPSGLTGGGSGFNDAWKNCL
jgi:hypothetical protein